jgi:tetratricopeptide (TPR) repeat protein
MEQLDKNLARDLLRRYDLVGAATAATAAIETASNPWPYRLVLLDVQRLKGKRAEALKELEHLAEIDPPHQEDVESCIGIKKLRGYYAGLLGRYKLSHQLLLDAEELAHSANVIESLAEVYQCQAMIHFLQRSYAESDRIFRLILNLSRQIGGWYFRGSALWGIGKTQMIQKHYQEAIPWLQQSLAVFENERVELSMALVWSEMAVCHLGLGDDRQSLDLLRRAEAVQHENGTVANYQIVLGNIGNVYLYRKDYPTSISYYQRALTIAHEIKDPVSIHKWTYNTSLALLRMRAAVD